MANSVITISAPYGAGGGIVGPKVAARLGVPFLDRVIPTEVARTLAVPLDEAEAHDERTESRIGHVLAALAASAPLHGHIPEGAVRDTAFREQTERVIVAAAQTTGCVVLGRAAVIVLRDHPGALHTCLTGSLDRRVQQALTFTTDDEATVRKLLADTDRNRQAYFKHFYRAEPDDPRLYHLMIDATAVDLDTCADLIVTAAGNLATR
jgi:cytidylate kinase